MAWLRTGALGSEGPVFWRANTFRLCDLVYVIIGMLWASNEKYMQVPGTQQLLIKYINFNNGGVDSPHHTMWKRDPFLFAFRSHSWNVWFKKPWKLKLGSQQPCFFISSAGLWGLRLRFQLWHTVWDTCNQPYLSPSYPVQVPDPFRAQPPTFGCPWIGPLQPWETT